MLGLKLLAEMGPEYSLLLIQGSAFCPGYIEAMMSRRQPGLLQSKFCVLNLIQALADTGEDRNPQP